MPKENNKILKYNHGKNSIKASFIIYADMKSLLEKINTCHNNTEKSSTSKINQHTPSGYLLFTQCSFDATKNNLDYCIGKECMKKFRKDLTLFRMGFSGALTDGCPPSLKSVTHILQ